MRVRGGLGSKFAGAEHAGAGARSSPVHVVELVGAWRRGGARKCSTRLRSGANVAFRAESETKRRSQRLVAGSQRLVAGLNGSGGSNPSWAVWSRKDDRTRAASGPLLPSAPHVQGSGLAPRPRPTASQSYRTLSSSTRSLRSLQLPHQPATLPGQARPRSQSIGLTCSSSAPHVQGSGLAPRPTASQSYRTLSSSTRSLRSLQLPARHTASRTSTASITVHRTHLQLVCSTRPGLRPGSSAYGLSVLPDSQLINPVVAVPTASSDTRTSTASITVHRTHLQLVCSTRPGLRPGSSAYGLSVLPDSQLINPVVAVPTASSDTRTSTASITVHRTHLQLVCSTRPGLRPGSSAYGLSVLPDSQLINPVVAVPTASSDTRTSTASITVHRTHLQLVCSTRPGLRPGSSAYGLSVLPDSQLINPVVAVPTASSDTRTSTASITVHRTHLQLVCSTRPGLRPGSSATVSSRLPRCSAGADLSRLLRSCGLYTLGDSPPGLSPLGKRKRGTELARPQALLSSSDCAGDLPN